ncbi:MAG TPA: [Fe-Fe] hydrogenase large subunit C-terminal domain-containing protein [Candidatus Dojkabacteria bacterium]|nr:[Fe-Fe] hydrogenase large subunit C-terminal domain-containing protein [Candidatus Dojkabacteria bacterium]
MNTKNPAVQMMLDTLHNKGDRTLSVQIAPAVRVSIGEYLGFETGTNLVQEMIGALKQMGFDYVFDTNFGADLTVIEEAFELVERLKKHKLLPMFTTCCPSWYMFVERLYPDLIPYLSTVKSPQAILASLVKTFFSQSINVGKGKMFHAVVAPCAMKKEEAKRQELWVLGDEPNIDLVLTTKEFVELLNELSIDLHNVAKADFDNPLGLSSGAGAIFGTTGGVMEATLRTAYYYYTGKDLEDFELLEVRNSGLKKEGKIDFAGIELNVCTVNSLEEAKPILEEIRATGTCKYQFIEVMNCPLGCIGGVGQWTTDREVLLKRREAIFKYDKEHKYQAAHQNQYIRDLYDKYIGVVGSAKAHELMHTHYTDKSSDKAEEFSCKFPKQE